MRPLPRLESGIRCKLNDFVALYTAARVQEFGPHPLDDMVTRGLACDQPVHNAAATLSVDHLTPIGTPVGCPGSLLHQSEATLTTHGHCDPPAPASLPAQ